MSETRTVQSTIPIPDPTEITSREIAKLKREMEKAISDVLASTKENTEAHRETISVKLEAVNTAASASIRHARELSQGRLDALAELTNERIEGLKIAFREDKIAAATAVAAAFAAQEKLNIAQNLSNSAAITKSEGSTTKELQSLNEKIESLKQIFQSDVRNLEGRLNRGEGGVSGARDTRVDHRAEVGQALLIAGVLVSIAIGLAPLVFGQRPGATPQVVYLPAPAAAGAIVAAPKP